MDLSRRTQPFTARALINAGVYLLSGGLLDDIAAGEAASIERDVFERLPSGIACRLCRTFSLYRHRHARIAGAGRQVSLAPNRVVRVRSRRP